MIACFLSNISAKYYKNPSMLSRVIAKNVGDVFFETVYRRWPRFPRGCGADMEQLVEIPHIVIFTGVF